MSKELCSFAVTEYKRSYHANDIMANQFSTNRFGLSQIKYSWAN